MRRENSQLNTSFLSVAGLQLYNNDYYGSAELEKYACYAVADGIESGDVESHSARIAVQAAIAAFHERPSISKRALRRYARAAHKALRGNGGHLSLRASITIVVTDYQKVRYAWAGNARFYLYRAGRLLIESRDHSLARAMADRGDITPDKIALHEERANLAKYAGQPNYFRPQVSKKSKLQNGDIFALITRGVWELCDAGDIRAALDSAENDPVKALEGLERLILDQRPEDIDNYTAAVVFADKVYTDPNRGKKIKRILAIAIPAFVILASICVVLWVLHVRKEAKLLDMRTAFVNAVEYVEDNNYVRAGEEIKKAVDLAASLKEQEFRLNAGNHQKLIDAVLNADSLYASGSYEEAIAAYKSALDRSRYTDGAGSGYAERRLAAVSAYQSVRDLISLGDILTASGSYDSAETKYLDARRLAVSVNDVDGRKLALDALENVYTLRDRDKAAAAEAMSERADQMEAQGKTLQEAVDMESAGDKAAADKDYLGAKLNYSIARERYTALGEKDSVSRVNGKLASVANAQADKNAQAEVAAAYTGEGDALCDAGDYVAAKVKYIYARNIYSRIQDAAGLAEALSKIEVCDAMISDSRNTEPESSPQPSAEPSSDPAPETTKAAEQSPESSAEGTDKGGAA